MGRQANITIKESIEDLKTQYKKESNSKVKLRIKSLIYTKEKRYHAKHHPFTSPKEEDLTLLEK